MRKILTLVLVVSLLLSVCSFSTVSASGETLVNPYDAYVLASQVAEYGATKSGNEKNITLAVTEESLNMKNYNLNWVRFNSLDFGDDGANKLTLKTSLSEVGTTYFTLFVLDADSNVVNRAADVYNKGKDATTGWEYSDPYRINVSSTEGDTTYTANKVKVSFKDMQATNEGGYYYYTMDLSSIRTDLSGVKDIIISGNATYSLYGFKFEEIAPVNPYTTISVNEYSEFGSNKATNDSGASSAITSGLAKFNNPNLRWLRFDNLDFGDVGAKSITLNLDTANTTISSASNVFTIFAFDHTKSLVNRTYTPWSNDASIYIDSAGTDNVGGVKVGDTVYTNIKKYTYGTTSVGSTITIDFDSPVKGTKDIILYTNTKPALTGFYFTAVPTSTPATDFNFKSPDEHHMQTKGAPQWGWGTTSDEEEGVEDYLLYKKVDFGNGSKLYNVQIGYNREWTQPCVVKVYLDNDLAGSIDIANTGSWGSASATPSYLGTLIHTNGVHDVKFVFDGKGCDVQDLKFSEVTTQIGDLNEKSVTFTLNNAESATVRLILAKYDTVDDRLNEVILEDVKVDSSTFSKTLTLTENKSTDETVKAFIWRTDIMPLTVCREY